MEAVVEKINPGEWASLAKDAHLICFNEVREPSMDRIDYALINSRDGDPLNYCTVRELDSESVYWQYGGAFPNSKGTGTTYYSYQRNAEWTFEQGYKRITTYIENNNVAMLKIAIKVGFRVIGTRTFNNHIMLELLLEKEWI
jgi:RimJ/RimL family protein N-acetyltransferase